MGRIWGTTSLQKPMTPPSLSSAQIRAVWVAAAVAAWRHRCVFLRPPSSPPDSSCTSSSSAWHTLIYIIQFSCRVSLFVCLTQLPVWEDGRRRSSSRGRKTGFLDKDPTGRRRGFVIFQSLRLWYLPQIAATRTRPRFRQQQIRSRQRQIKWNKRDLYNSVQ